MRWVREKLVNESVIFINYYELFIVIGIFSLTLDGDKSVRVCSMIGKRITYGIIQQQSK